MVDSFCGWRDPRVSGEHLEIQTAGSLGTRWPRTSFDWRLGDIPPPKGGMSIATFKSEIAQAFLTIQQVTPLTFTEITSGQPHLLVELGGKEFDERFGSPGGVAASAWPPVLGQIQFDYEETWLPRMLAGGAGTLLLPVALHEICHALGVGHSDRPTSIMYPYSPPTMTWLDAETIQFLNTTYRWSLARRTGGETADRPSLVSVPWASFGDGGENLSMFFIGSGSSQLFEQTRAVGAWSPSAAVDTAQSSHSPSLTSMTPAADGAGRTALACKGPGDNKNPHLAQRIGAGPWQWERFSDWGSTQRPAIAFFDDDLWMVWRGGQDDRGLYWSVQRNGHWADQMAFPESGSTDAPALAVLADRLWAFWKGVEGDSTIYYTSRGAGDSFWDAQKQLRWEDVTTAGAVWGYPGTSTAPSVTFRSTALGDSLFVVWKGAEDDTRIFFSQFDGNEFSGQMPISDFRTDTSPDIAFHRSTLVLAWKGVESSEIFSATL